VNGGIVHHDRVFIAGRTGSGKSELINVLFSGFACQRLLVDTKDEFDIPGVERVRDVAAIDWSEPIIHYVDSSSQAGEFDELFEACLRRRHLVVAVHELADLCEHSPGRTPRAVNAYITKGRAHGLGLLGGSQRPVNIPRTARTEVQHVFAFVPPMDPDDRPVIARMMELEEPALLSLLAQARAKSPTGEHSFLWYEQRARELKITPPLPDDVRRRSIVRRRTVA
jgi:hypothetical protein